MSGQFWKALGGALAFATVAGAGRTLGVRLVDKALADPFERQPNRPYATYEHGMPHMRPFRYQPREVVCVHCGAVNSEEDLCGKGPGVAAAGGPPGAALPGDTFDIGERRSVDGWGRDEQGDKLRGQVPPEGGV